MKAPHRVLALLAIVGLATACTTGQRPPWTYPPATPSGAPSASVQPSGAIASPTSVPQTGDSVLPVLTPKADLQPVPAGEVNTAYAPNVPPAATRTNQAIVEVHFDVIEGVKAIDPNGLEYTTWGYRLHGDNTVTTGTPGPIIRARVGDVLRFMLTNVGSMPHNVDFHAVTGQGGGAKDLTIAPGETATIEARMLYPGMFMYHCAAGDVPLHISQGMYGGILVDPQTPLSPVEHELYMVQSEFYTSDPNAGPLTTDRQAITDEMPTFVVFNGAKGSLTGDNAPKMQVGEKMRIYFVNAGLNLDSNFHPIGSHWDKVWEDGGLLNAPLRGLQTVLVPAGGGTVVELDALVPMTVVLVDHALARAFDKGAIGQIVITGDPNPEIFESFGKTGTPAPTTVPASATPVASGTPVASATAPGSPGAGLNIEIAPGAFTYQAPDAADEFADTESPADYTPNVLMIPLGTTVTWTNNDPGQIHTVTAADGSFDSGFLSTGQTFSYTFDNPGTFDYSCLPHPWMQGRIEVMMH
ncbi:MAG: plastocyanin/azurin family copper-binding protein [Chloroflexota bacterium]|nr:plastocyanin/azurin family copper-binding protein [Chloroflexota bacterium]